MKNRLYLLTVAITAAFVCGCSLPTGRPIGRVAGLRHRSLDSGYKFLAGIDASGKTVVWGSPDSKVVRHFKLKPSPENQIGLAAGVEHLVSLGSDGQVTAWGPESDPACQVNDNWRYEQIAAGGFYTVLVRKDGVPMFLGPDADKQDWERKLENGIHARGRVLEGAERWPSAVFCGPESVSLITRDGRLQTWTRQWADRFSYKIRSGLRDGAYTQRFMVLLKQNGDVSIDGLWHDPSWVEDRAQPEPPPSLHHITRVAVSENSRVMALDQDGGIHEWGLGLNNQYRKVLAKPAAEIVAGGHFQAALLKDGTVKIWMDPLEYSYLWPNRERELAPPPGLRLMIQNDRE